MSSSNSSASFCFEYKGAPRGREYEKWREGICRSMFGLDIQPAEGDSIDCSFKLSTFARLALAAPEGASAQFSRTRETLADGCDDLVLVIAKGGSVLVTQNGEPIELSQSQMCLTDMTVRGTVAQSNTSRICTLSIPRPQLLAVLPRAEDRLSQVLGESAGLRRTIADYYALASSLAPQTDAVARHVMASHMVDLVGLLLSTDADRAESAGSDAWAAARLDLMRAEVLANLDWFELDLGRIAHKHGLSLRHAQRLFEQAGTTFTEFVLEQRLLLARTLLLDPLNPARKISDVAQCAGFASVSYFNRAFRTRFGMTPSDLRGA